MCEFAERKHTPPKTKKKGTSNDDHGALFAVSFDILTRFVFSLDQILGKKSRQLQKKTEGEKKA